MNITLKQSPRKDKKYSVIIEDTEGKKTIHFGAKGMKDFILYNLEDPVLAKKRKSLYIKRHFQKEDWTKGGIKTAGFWSYWLLWNKPTLQQSIADIEKRFKIKISKL